MSQIEEDIGYMVQETAREIFSQCGCEEDYCVQNVCSETLVFGGTNRVIWSPKGGYWCDENYCTDRFKERFKEIMGGG